MGPTVGLTDITPRRVFELLAALVEEYGYDEVKRTVDSMWDFLSHLESDDEW